jgi:hypothetical protein
MPSLRGLGSQAEYILKRGKTPVLTREETRQLLDSIETDTVGIRDQRPRVLDGQEGRNLPPNIPLRCDLRQLARAYRRRFRYVVVVRRSTEPTRTRRAVTSTLKRIRYEPTRRRKL